MKPSPSVLGEKTKSVTLTCTVKSLPDTALFWKFGNTNLATDITSSYNDDTAVTTSTNTSLTTKLIELHAAFFECPIV